MRTRDLFGCLLASMLANMSPARAETDTWDGGGLNDILLTSLNWADNTAPVSDIFNTDLIFAGAIRPTPIVSAPFSAHAIAFAATANSFVILGAELTLGIGGISNSSTHAMTFNTPVNFGSVPYSQISTTATGDLYFNNTVTLPTGTLSVGLNDHVHFSDIAGNGTLSGVGSIITLMPSVGIACDVEITSGELRMGADGSTDVFGPTASITFDATCDFTIHENLTLNGANLTTLEGSDVLIKLDAGKTLTVQNGSDVSIAGTFQNYSDPVTILVQGAGTTFSVGNMLNIFGGTSATVSSGASMSSGGSVNIGTNGDGTVSVMGAGSSLSGLTINIGLGGDSGSLTFSNQSTGTFPAIKVADTTAAGTNGSLTIQSGANVFATSFLYVASKNGASTGTVTITGANSVLTVGIGEYVGAASGSTATLNVQNGGRFNSGTGLTTVYPTGTVALVDGDFYSYGNLTIDGGQFTKDINSSLILASYTTLTVQAGGEMTFTSGYPHDSGATILVTGEGSTFSINGTLSVFGGSTLQVAAGGDVINTTNGNLTIGTVSGNATVTVDGAGSSLQFGNGGLTVGSANSETASLTFSNGATGAFAPIAVDTSSSSTTDATLRIESGSTVTGTTLLLAPNNIANTGNVTITGAGSTLTITIGTNAIIGAASGSMGLLDIESGGTFQSGTGLTTVNATGAITIGGLFSTYNSNGNLTLNGGQLTRANNGIFNLTAGHTFTIQGGGDATFTGSFFTGTASTIAVTGAGSTLSTTGTLAILGGSTLSIAAGGSVTSGAAQMNVGTSSGNGTITATGAGSSLSGGALSIGQNGNMASVTLSNGSSGTFDSIAIDSSAVAETNGALNIQSGASVTTTSLTIAPNAAANIGSVTITGTGSILTVNGPVTIGANSGSIGTVDVQSSSRLIAGPGATTLNGTGTLNITGGTVTLTGPLVRNGGTLNFVTGALNIIDDFAVGAGGLLGANVVLDYTRQFTTTGAAHIEVPGVLTFHGGTFSSSTLTNDGEMDFSGGNTNIQGDVVLNNSSHVTISSAGIPATFVNDVIHNGSEIDVAAGTNVVFSAGLSGAGPFTGAGTVHFDGQHHPGDPIALASFGGDVLYGPSAVLELELGGLVRGTSYDALEVTGKLTLDGSLNVVFTGAFVPQYGNAFDLFNWGSVSGAFAVVNLPNLGPGLKWDTAELYTEGRLAIVPEPSCAALFFTMVAILLAHGRRPWTWCSSVRPRTH
jgi:fibronectin-binding autotransporter adhesin